MRILITGAGGMLGSDLARTLAGDETRSLRRQDLDVCDRAAVERTIEEFQPDAVVHAAAFTHVDECERNPHLGLRVNGLGTRNVAMAAERVGASVLYVSTDYVFDGTKDSPYLEYDQPRPISQYGLSKLAGEEYVRSFCSRYTIVRTAWLFGHHGDNFVRKIVERIQRGETLSVVNDQIGSPSYTMDVAGAIASILDSCCYGIFHVTNFGSCSWFQFAKCIAEMLNESVGRIRPVRSSDFPTPTRRPANSRLENAALQLEGLSPLRPWQEALHEFLQELRVMPAKSG